MSCLHFNQKLCSQIMVPTYESKLNPTGQDFDLHQRWFENIKSHILYLPFYSKGKQDMNLLYLP